MKGAKKAIEAVADFCFNILGLKPALWDLQTDEAHFKPMAEHAYMGTGPMQLGPDDVENIYKVCL